MSNSRVTDSERVGAGGFDGQMQDDADRGDSVSDETSVGDTNLVRTKLRTRALYLEYDWLWLNLKWGSIPVQGQALNNSRQLKPSS